MKNLRPRAVLVPRTVRNWKCRTTISPAVASETRGCQQAVWHNLQESWPRQSLSVTLLTNAEMGRFVPKPCRWLVESTQFHGIMVECVVYFVQT